MRTRPFRSKDAQRMFEGKKVAKFANIAAIAERKLQLLDNAVTLQFLSSPPENRLEALSGNRQGQHSIRINDQFRICFVWTPRGPEMTKNGMRPIHPGEILREEFLVPLGLTPRALLKALHVPPSRINDIINEKRAITADTALRLARYFGGDPQSWLNLQQAYDLKMTSTASLKKILDEVQPRDPNEKGYALAA